MRKLILALTLVSLSAATIHAQERGGRMFTKFDANSDGQLDESEVTTLLKLRAEKQAKPDLATPAHINRFIKKRDTDGNGSISKAEMQAAAASAKRGASAGGDAEAE